MRETSLLRRVCIDSGVMLGKPVIKGTRLTIEHSSLVLTPFNSE